MAPPAAESSFDIAYWFLDRARDEGEYLQPQKLHRLMYLAQAYFAVAYRGRLLMPAVFVADALGPVEPNVFRACEIQRPGIEPRPLSEAVARFLDGVWRRYGHQSADDLTSLVTGHAPYVVAIAEGAGSEIPLTAMAAFYGRKVAPPGTKPPPQPARGPQVMRSQHGRSVAVQAWAPKEKGS